MRDTEGDNVENQVCMATLIWSFRDPSFRRALPMRAQCFYDLSFLPIRVPHHLAFVFAQGTTPTACSIYHLLKDIKLV